MVATRMTQTVSLSFFRFDSALARLWALGMMGAARLALPNVPDIGFWKLCGSGSGVGFTPLPNTAVYAILCTWPDEETARNALNTAKIFNRYHAKASESWSVFLTPTSSRGNWSGQEPFQPNNQTPDGPLAALTRATIKPSILAQFLRRVPDISDVIGNDPNVAFKIGIGELPLLHQVTFSIWPNAQSMADFARRDGPHARAIKAVRDGNWFAEELYARFRVIGEQGTWNGSSPLSKLDI